MALIGYKVDGELGFRYRLRVIFGGWLLRCPFYLCRVRVQLIGHCNIKLHGLVLGPSSWVAPWVTIVTL